MDFDGAALSLGGTAECVFASSAFAFGYRIFSVISMNTFLYNM